MRVRLCLFSSNFTLVRMSANIYHLFEALLRSDNQKHENVLGPSLWMTLTVEDWRDGGWVRAQRNADEEDSYKPVPLWVWVQEKWKSLCLHHLAPLHHPPSSLPSRELHNSQTGGREGGEDGRCGRMLKDDSRCNTMPALTAHHNTSASPTDETHLWLSWVHAPTADLIILHLVMTENFTLTNIRMKKCERTEVTVAWKQNIVASDHILMMPSY